MPEIITQMEILIPLFFEKRFIMYDIYTYVDMIPIPVSQNILADIIREVFSSYEISIESIILFGSRVSGNARADSDWDFLIITTKRFNHSLKRKITSEIRKKILFAHDIDVDLVVVPKEDMADGITDTGRMLYYAFRDGVAI